jgi:hypothetical protein
MSTRIIVAIVLLGAAASAIACLVHITEEREVTYENGTPFVLGVLLDDLDLTTLRPGESRGFRTNKILLPNRIKAFDEQGNLRFDRVFTWEDLEANEFRVLIR